MARRDRFKVGDLVRFNDKKRRTITSSEYAKYHLRHIFEIGLVTEVQGNFPVVSFPSKSRIRCATRHLKVIATTMS